MKVMSKSKEFIAIKTEHTPEFFLKVRKVPKPKVL